MSEGSCCSIEEHKHPTKDNYWPLIALVLIAALAGTAVCFGVNGTQFDWMHYFMGIFLCQFAMLKIFDVPGFADGFQMYDLIAMRCRPYALLYPFIELALGLAYLSQIAPYATYITTIGVMLIGSIGVVISLAKGLDLRCSCMGSVLNVPLSTVTLTEDIGMGLMALSMLLMSS